MPPPPDAASRIEYLAWFRFPVTWTYVSGPLPEVKSEAAPKPLPASPPLTLVPIGPPPLSQDPVTRDSASDEGLRAAASAARWEMMVPKMARPPARPVANLSAGAAPQLAAPAQAANVPASVPSPAAPVSAENSAVSASSEFTPSFLVNAPEDRFLARFWPQIVFVTIAIVAIGCVVWGLSGPAAAPSQATTSPVKAPSWSRQPVLPSGRSLTVYEPSRRESDYRIEFSWVPDSAGVGWVFRIRDGNNYDAARLSLQQSGADRVLVAEHFSVFAGAESPHSRKAIPFKNAMSLVRVHMDAIGPAFKLFLENNPADSWTDARLSTGALGFYCDGDQLPKLLAPSFTFIHNGVSRTAVASLP